MRKQLYLDIKERLLTIKDEHGEPLFKHFDLWNRQVEFIEEETPFKCPAVFIEFGVMAWRTAMNRVQDCELTVTLHIVTEWYADTSHYSPTEQQSLSFLDTADLVVATMQNFHTDNMNAWMRSRSITNHNHEHYVDSIEEFVCNLRDFSAVPQRAV